MSDRPCATCTGYSLKRTALVVFTVCLLVTAIILTSGFWISLGRDALLIHRLYYSKGSGLSVMSARGNETAIGGLVVDRSSRDRLLAGVRERLRAKPASWRSDETQYSDDGQFLFYMQCPSSVRHRLLTDPFFRDRYLPEVPALLWAKHYSHDEFVRLSQFDQVYGWSFTNENVIRSALGALNTASNAYLFDNDRYPGQRGCTTCAVIGNGGILNGSRMGKEIDARDYVFRVNVALTQGYEEDVGNKTSFYCAAFRSLRNSLRSGWPYGFRAPPYQKGIRYVFFPKTELAYKFVSAQIRNELHLLTPEERGSLPNFQTHLTAKDLKLVHPDFQRYLKFRWVNSTNKHLTIHRPSTGAIMLLLALHTCDKVDVYGFGGEIGRYTNYYYDRVFTKQRIYLDHDSKAEIRLWRTLHDLGVINLYTRD